MNYDDNNVFARIIRKEIPCNIVYEDDAILAFHDVSPAAPVHILIVPKAPYVSFDGFVQYAGADSVAHFFTVVQKVAVMMQIDASGYRLITNHGTQAAQSVPHFHVHLLGGRFLGGLLTDDKEVR